MRVRFRVDGVLAETTTVPRRMVRGVVSRIKIMADLDIAERRAAPGRPRRRCTVEGRHVDIRVVTLPACTARGSSCASSTRTQALHRPGQARHARGRASDALRRRRSTRPTARSSSPGPTGSGKTTTLYAALNADQHAREEHHHDRGPGRVPARRHHPGPGQPARRASTFATGLRSMMRADPDVIMVGEIRDRETAQIAIEAALTGHLVLSTLHTNDAPTAITRLVEMGIEPFLVASALDASSPSGWRARCARTARSARCIPADALRGRPASTSPSTSRPTSRRAAPAAAASGYKGRIGLYEVMTRQRGDPPLTIERASADEIARSRDRAGHARASATTAWRRSAWA